MAPTETPVNLNSYHSKLVGVTFEGRQDIIGMMDGTEPLRFRREPENEYDENAVAIDAKVYHVADEAEWLPIGYIARDKNSELAQLLTDGKFCSIKLKDITGGEYNAKTDRTNSLGVNVYIEHERPRRLTRSPNAKLIKDFFGNEIFYDDHEHEYTNALGEIYMSGSKFAHSEGTPFDAKQMSNDIVERYGLDKRLAGHIRKMWNINGDASRNYGKAIHSAIELYGTYHALATKIDTDLKTGKRKTISAKVEKNSALSKLLYLKNVVNNFFTPERLAEKAYYEVLVVDHENRRAGRIDRLVELEDGSFVIRDMKTNFKILKPERDEYSRQLSFYADIVVANGKTLGENPVMLHHLVGEKWTDIKLEKIDTLA